MQRDQILKKVILYEPTAYVANAAGHHLKELSRGPLGDATYQIKP